MSNILLYRLIYQNKLKTRRACYKREYEKGDVMAIGALAIFMVLGAVFLLSGVLKKQNDYEGGDTDNNKVK